MNKNKLSQLESLLFAVGKPMTIKDLALALSLSEDETGEMIKFLQAKMNSDESGLHLALSSQKVQLVSNPSNGKFLRDYFKDELNSELTKPSLETLTIIAYRQPISKEELEQIRGVNCSLILRNLLIKGLAETKTAGVGGEALYSVTFDLLRHLGITKVEELPDYDKLSKSEILDRILNLTAEPIDNQQISV